MGIQNRNGALFLATGIDNSGLYSGLNKAEGRIDQFGNHISAVGDKITKLTGIGFGIAGLKAFGSEIINVTGEMQMLESSFEVLLGGKGVSGFMSEMKQFAVDSPLSMNGVANAAQTLLGFGITAEKVMPTIKQIGDISMGNEERFKSLSLAFAQMSATGKLMGQDLLQMINAGFNPLQIISEKTGKSIGDLKKEMESGSISSQMVVDAFAAATSQGGKFYGMTQKQAEGIKGLQAQLDGGIQDAFNDLGKSQEDLITGGYKAAISLVENYEKVGKSLMALIATYGTYRTAIALNISLEKGWTISQLAHYKVLLLVEKAQKLLNTTMFKNPLVMVATVAVGLVGTLWALYDATSTQEKAQKKLNDIMEEAKEKKENLENKSSSLTGTINSETKTIYDQIIAYKELQGLYPELLKDMDLQTFKALGATKQQKMLNEALNEMDVENLDTEIKKYEDALSGLGEKYRNATVEGQKFTQEVDKMAGLDGFFRFQSEDKVREALNTILKGLKEQKEEQKRIREEAELLNLPEAERKAVLEKQLWALEKQKEYIEGQIGSVGGLRSEWNKFNPIFNALNSQLEDILKKIKETEGKLSTDTPTQNKAYWEKQKKDATEALEAMAPSDKGSKAWREQLALINEANKKLKTWDFSNKGDSAAQKIKQQAEQLAKEQEQYNLLLDKQKIERKRAIEDLENQVTQAGIDKLQEGAEKKEKQRELDNALEIQAIERQKEDYIQKYIQAEREKFDARENIEATKNEKYKKNTFNPLALPAIDTSYFDKMLQSTKEKHANYPKELAIREAKDWNDYLIQFGDYQQKRKAIIDKYDREINEAETKGQKATFEKEKQNALDELDNSIKGSTNLMAQLFADTSQKSVNEIQKIIDKVELLLKYLEAAKDENGNAVIDGKTYSKDDILGLGISDNTLDNLKNSAQEVEALKNGLKGLKGDLGSKSPFKQFESQIKDAVGAIKSGNLSGGISGIGNATSQIMPQIKEFGQNIANMFGDDELAEDIGHATDALTGLGDTAAGVGQIMSGDIVGGIMSAVSGITTMVSAFGDLFGSSDELTQATIDTYNRYMSTVDKLIDKQKELLESVSGTDAVILANQAREAIQRQIDATREITSDWLSSKSGGKFSGGNWRGADKVLNNYKKELKTLGYDISSAQYDLITLSPEKLEEIRNELPKMWADFDANLSGWLDTIIDLGEAMEEISNAEKERLTGLSFDSLKNSLDDLLQSADTTFEDIGNSFEDHMRNSVLNFVKSRYLTDALKDWYAQFAEAYDDDVLSKSEVDLLRGMYEEAYNKAQNLYDSALDAMGIDKGEDTRSSQAKGFATASQDSIDRVEGLWTISVEHSRGILEFTGNIHEQLKAMNIDHKGILTACNSILMYTHNIDKNTQELYGMRKDIAAMRGDIYSLVNSGITLKK